ncbi:MAG: hypothetical protein ACI4TL_04535 [Candidatus Cryptobacteroides sp.]
MSRSNSPSNSPCSPATLTCPLLWWKKAQEYPLLYITVSDFLEKNATAELQEMGANLGRLGGRGEVSEGKYCLYD